MDNPAIGIIVFIVIVFGIVLFRAALSARASGLQNKLADRSEDRRRQQLLENRQTDPTKQKE